MESKFFKELAKPKELTFGECCPNDGDGAIHGLVPYWEGEQIYPYCGGCATLIDDLKLRREQGDSQRASSFAEKYESHTKKTSDHSARPQH